MPPPAPQVADQFSKRFYEVLTKHPKFINRFYKDESAFALHVFGPYGAYQSPVATFNAKGPTVRAPVRPTSWHVLSTRISAHMPTLLAAGYSRQGERDAGGSHHEDRRLGRPLLPRRRRAAARVWLHSAHGASGVPAPAAGRSCRQLEAHARWRHAAGSVPHAAGGASSWHLLAGLAPAPHTRVAAVTAPAAQAPASAAPTPCVPPPHQLPRSAVTPRLTHTPHAHAHPSPPLALLACTHARRSPITMASCLLTRSLWRGPTRRPFSWHLKIRGSMC